MTEQWLKTVLPMYKASTQKNHRHIVTKHVCPRFGDQPMSTITRQEVQAYVAHLVQVGYAPKTVDHIHDVLSAILRTAVGWGHLDDNPARGVRLPKLRTVRSKWVLTTTQAVALLEALPPLARTHDGVGVGVRHPAGRAVRPAVAGCRCRRAAAPYPRGGLRGHVRHPEDRGGSPRHPVVRCGDAGHRRMEAACDARRARSAGLRDAVRQTHSPNNVLRRWIFPACVAHGLPHATWLTFRRTYSTWAHEKGVPGKIVAQVMGHAKVDTTLNVYTQVLEGSVRTAVETVGAELFRIVQSSEGASALIH